MNPAPSLDSKDLEMPMIISKKLLNKREGAG